MPNEEQVNAPGSRSRTVVPKRSSARYWTVRRLEAARRRLAERSAMLRADIQRELRKYDADRYGVLADQVGDTDDDAVADVLVDLELAEIDRDAEELREIDAAFKRIAAGTYGVCVECGEPIDPERLKQMPHAARDLACEQRIDERHAGHPHPEI